MHPAKSLLTALAIASACILPACVSTEQGPKAIPVNHGNAIAVLENLNNDRLARDRYDRTHLTRAQQTAAARAHAQTAIVAAKKKPPAIQTKPPLYLKPATKPPILKPIGC